MYALCPKCGKQILDNGLKEILICSLCKTEIKSRAYDPFFYQKTVNNLKNDLFLDETFSEERIQVKSNYNDRSFSPIKNVISFISIIAALGPVSAALGGLIWIFALFNLEDKKGKYLLYATFVCLIGTSIAVGFTSFSAVDSFINSEAFENIFS